MLRMLRSWHSIGEVISIQQLVLQLNTLFRHENHHQCNAYSLHPNKIVFSMCWPDSNVTNGHFCLQPTQFCDVPAQINCATCWAQPTLAKKKSHLNAVLKNSWLSQVMANLDTDPSKVYPVHRLKYKCNQSFSVSVTYIGLGPAHD